MGRHIHLQPHLSVDELEHRYRTAKEPNERTWWQILWLLAQGHTATELSAVIGYRAYWIGQLARCADLQHQPALIRSTTCFHWWPRQIHTRLGPRRR